MEIAFKHPVYWGIEIYRNPNGDDMIASCAGYKTFDLALEAAVKDASYYVGVGYNPSYVVSVYCNTCYGTGSTRIGKRIKRDVECKKCKGVGQVAKFGPFNLQIHPNVKVIPRDQYADIVKFNTVFCMDTLAPVSPGRYYPIYDENDKDVLVMRSKDAKGNFLPYETAPRIVSNSYQDYMRNGVIHADYE